MRSAFGESGYLVRESVLDAADCAELRAVAERVSILVHSSTPNRTNSHRRALLPSWQPAGRPRLHDFPYRPDRVTDLP